MGFRSFINVISLAYRHIVYSRYATFWFLLAFFHCIVQIGLQAVAFRENTTAQSMLTNHIPEDQLPAGVTMIIDHTLQRCNGIPHLSSTACQIVSGGQTNYLAQGDSNVMASMFNSTLPNGTQVTLSSQCVYSLSWFEDVIRDAKVEDVVTLCFQLWLFAISLLAVLNDSIPHLAVSVAGRLLHTAWTGFRIKGLMRLRISYNRFILQGACNGVDFLGDWWGVRMSRAIPLVAYNAVSLAFMTYLALILFHSFAKQTFGRVGASPVIDRIYKLVLCYQANLDLAAFFVVSSVAMWIDILFKSTIRHLVIHIRLFQAASIISAIIMPLWILAGSMSIFREIRWLFSVFGILKCFIIASWVTAFTSDTYLYELDTWPFFTTVSITAFVFLLSTAVTGVLCRLNFGKGFAHFLRVQEVLGSLDFTPGYFDNGRTRPASEDGSFFSSADLENLKEQKFNGSQSSIESHFTHDDHWRRGLLSHETPSLLKRWKSKMRHVLLRKERGNVRSVTVQNPGPMDEPSFQMLVKEPPAAALSSVWRERDFAPNVRTAAPSWI